MAKEKSADAPKVELEAETEAPVVGSTPTPAPQQTLTVDDAHSTASYANFCRVTGSPEELIVDFGLNPQPIGIPTDPIEVKQRIIMNYYTAKRLLGALNMSIQRHESVFGVLETDINQRLKMPQPC